MSDDRTLKFGAILHGASGPGAPELWRDPEVPIDASLNIGWYLEQARQAEESFFDFVFLVDSQYIDASYPPHQLNRLEPISALSAIAAHTDRIGLVGTISTTYAHPFETARRLASLDQISDGRAGWNVVTGYDLGTAGNFGVDAHEDYDVRYRRAAEHIDVVKGLWDSYAPDAFATSKDAPRYLVDEGRLHRLDHRGEFYSVTGPLSIVPSRQGQPVVIHSGQSEHGRRLAGERSEVCFNFAPDIDWGRTFADDVRAHARESGRDGPSIVVLPGLCVVIAPTDEEARELDARRTAARSVDVLTAGLSRLFGHYDFTRHDLDEKFASIDLSGHRTAHHRAEAIKERALREDLTIRQVATADSRTSVLKLVGSPSTVAQEIVRWFEHGAADGFNLFVEHPSDFASFRREVIPLLQERGLYRTSYEGQTLRDHLGLEQPQRRHPAAAR